VARSRGQLLNIDPETGEPSIAGASAGGGKVTKNPDGTHSYEGPTINPDAGDDPDLARAYGVGAPEGMSDEDAAMAGHTIGRGGSPGLPVDKAKLAAMVAAQRKAKDNPTPEYSGKVVKPRSGSRSAALVRGAPRENQELPRKISVREAKELTRRIVERIRKEAK